MPVKFAECYETESNCIYQIAVELHNKLQLAERAISCSTLIVADIQQFIQYNIMLVEKLCSIASLSTPVAKLRFMITSGHIMIHNDNGLNAKLFLSTSSLVGFPGWKKIAVPGKLFETWVVDTEANSIDAEQIRWWFQNYKICEEDSEPGEFAITVYRR